MKLTRYLILTLVAGVLILTIFFSSIINFVTDWWWFSDVGYTDIFLKSLYAKIIIGFAAGTISGLFLIINFFIAYHSKISWIGLLPPSLTGQAVSISDRIVKKISLIASFILAILIGLIAAANWQEILKYLSASTFNQNDPIFNMDIGFYVFSLPVYTFTIQLLKFIITASLIGSLIIYLLRGKFNFIEFIKLINKKSKSVSVKIIDKPTRIHLAFLLFLLFLLIALDTHFSIYNFLFTQSGPVSGASYTDANIMIPIIQISAYVYVLAALAALFYGISGKIAPFIGSLFLSFIVGVASAAVPALVQKLIVSPNELVKETPYIKSNIKATRQAYNLDKIEVREIDTDKELTAKEIAENDITIKNIRLWDRDPLLSTFSQIQEIRTYYEFLSVDNDRYNIDGEIRQIMLSTRELATNSLPNKNWINEHLTFTHGYGIAAGPVNQVTPEGLPLLFVKDLPPKSDKKELKIERPEIYYGEISNDFVIVNTKSKEFDYPKGDENVYTNHKDTGGVPMDSIVKKILYAIYFNSLKILLSGDVTNESRILYDRDVQDRISKIAPFLTYDSDPYLVVADGKLYWIQDAYTISNSYPYSQPLAIGNTRINYIRNSVKIVLDAYSGKVTFYQSDPNDPIIKSYAKIFPNAFKPISKMPKSLSSHIRYPEDIFSLQTSIYTTYHMDDPQIFYNKEDQWEIPAIISDGERSGEDPTAIAPRHMIMKLPGEKKEEFILMLPFTPRAKDNLSAWMVARNDGQQYGKLAVYSFPKDKLIYGPKQVIGRINQDAEVSRQISLWDQRGSQVIQGPLLVIPIENSLVYVRPLYLKAESGKIPELKRVIVAYGNKIAMEETLEEALAKIFGSGSSSTQSKESTDKNNLPENESPEQVEETTSTSSLLQQASGIYESAINAQKNGDWTKYGEEIKKLGEILNELNR